MAHHMIIYNCNKGTAGRRKTMENENMTDKEFKTIIEMIILIIEGSETKEEALEKLKNLSINKK